MVDSMTNNEKLSHTRFLLSVLNSEVKSLSRAGKKKDLKKRQAEKDILLKKIDKLLKI